jgi:glycosyltransferase involved in cell wall biosynthesis
VDFAITDDVDRRPKLLFVSPRFLFPADCGGKIRTRDILRGMKGGRFHITLASPAPVAAQTDFAGELARVCDRFAGWPEASGRLGRSLTRWLALLSYLPVAVATDRSRAGRAAVAAELRRGVELVVADFPHARVLLPPRLPHPLVVFTHNVEAEIFRRHASVARSLPYRWVWRAEAWKMQRFEHAVARAADTVVAVSERDGKHFAPICGSDRIVVIPTGVDLSYFSFDDREPPVDPEGGTVVFTGSMDWLANVDGIGYFMDEVWPLVLRRRQHARMVVVGRNPPASLASRARTRGLAWTFTGFVDDVRPYVRDANVYVIPLRVGGGTRIKAYEAMAMGRAIVSTSIGVEGLPVTAGRDYVRADSAEAFADGIVHLLADAQERRNLAANARQLVERNFSAEIAAATFERACEQAIATVAEARAAAATASAA